MIAGTRHFWAKHQDGDDYLSLIREFPLRTIRTSSQHDGAMQMVRRLAIANEGSLSGGEREYLDALTILLEDYDRRHEPWQRISGLQLLKHLMAEHHMKVADLGKLVGSRPLASLILSGKRDISKDVMKRLGAHFRLDPGAFL